MAWFKVDDSLHDHPKVRRAGAAAAGVWVTAGSFCGAYKTGGFVPTWWIRTWGKVGTSSARKLVEVGLWEEAEKDGEQGYQFHDWNDYQPSPEEVERDREMARERQRRSRERKSRHAAGDHSICDRCSQKQRDTSVTVTRDVTPESRVSHAVSHGTPSRPVPSRPDKGQGQGQKRDDIEATTPPPGGGLEHTRQDSEYTGPIYGRALFPGQYDYLAATAKGATHDDRN